MTRTTKFKGITLLEILISISIFAFMFVFISQIIKQNYRQNRKIKQDIQTSNSLSHTLALIRQDLQGVSYLLDLNANLNFQFPIELNSDEEPSLSTRDSSSQTQDKDNLQDKQHSVSSPFLNPHFTFEGEDQNMSFVSYSFSNSSLDRSSGQWMNIRYSLRDCASRRETLSGSCLFRSVHRYWENEKDNPPEETLILLKDIQSLKFFYADVEGFLEDTWEEKWAPNPETETTYIQKIPFPYAIKIRIEKDSSVKQNMVFFVSSFYLKSWNPYEKNYPGFPKWNAPRRKSRNPEQQGQNQHNPNSSISIQGF